MKKLDPMYPHFDFQITHASATSRARRGRLTTPHGTVETPAFIFCATKAAIKGATPRQMKEAGTQIMLSNTYHLMLRPGSELIQKQGGLHTFMGWKGPLLTDSGGFQIFSLGHGSVASEIKGKRFGTRQKTVLSITEEGARFKSYLDGRIHMLTPEKSIQVQRQLGADLILVLDECTPFHVDKSYTEASMHLSHRWALRSLQEFQRTATQSADTHTQALYGIVQGGVYPDLRRQAAQFVAAQPFFGYAVGGSLGAAKNQMHEVVATTLAALPPARPVHLLGIGGIEDIFLGVAQGVDTFDCVHPTRLARHGGALVPFHVHAQEGEGSRNALNLRNARYQEDPRPLDEQCPCETCQTYPRSYLHHLFKAGEVLGLHLLTLHNVTFMNRLLARIRLAITEDRLKEERAYWLGT